MGYEWDFAAPLRDPEWLLYGLIGTIGLTLGALLIAFPIGLFFAIIRMSKLRVANWLATGYIDFLRTTPTLVLFFWTYFGLPLLIGLKLSAFTVAVLALGLQYSAFFAEIIRAGIVSIERGQWEAAQAIGLRYSSIMRWVILPPALRRMIPAFLSHTADIVKGTALASAISYSELLQRANEVAVQTYRPIETLTIAAGMYFIVLFSLSRAVSMLETRLAVSDAKLDSA